MRVQEISQMLPTIWIEEGGTKTVARIDSDKGENSDVVLELWKNEVDILMIVV